MGLVLDFWAQLFQSHAGSIEASASMGTRDDGPEVSIPRWFD